MYKVTFIKKSGAPAETYVEESSEFLANHAVSCRKDYDMRVSTELLSEDHADLIRNQWVPFSDWKWTKEIGDRNVVLRVSTESDKDWEVFVTDDGEAALDTPFVFTSFSDAIAEAKRIEKELQSMRPAAIDVPRG